MRPKGSVYTVVENAGYVGERDIRSFPYVSEAYHWLHKTYAADEIDSLHVLIRRDHRDGTSTYEF